MLLNDCTTIISTFMSLIHYLFIRFCCAITILKVILCLDSLYAFHSRGVFDITFLQCAHKRMLSVCQ